MLQVMLNVMLGFLEDNLDWALGFENNLFRCLLFLLDIVGLLWILMVEF